MIAPRGHIFLAEQSGDLSHRFIFNFATSLTPLPALHFFDFAISVSLPLNVWLVTIVRSFTINCTMQAFFYTDSAFGTFFTIDFRIICKDRTYLFLFDGTYRTCRNNDTHSVSVTFIFVNLYNHDLSHAPIALNEYNCFARIVHNRTKSINVKYLHDKYRLSIF